MIILTTAESEMKYADLTTDLQRIHHIKHMVATNKAWALRGLIRIYERQTANEQRVGETTRHNNVGFTGADANILSSLADQVLAKRNLSEKQMAIVHKKMPKYARQLLNISKSS